MINGLPFFGIDEVVNVLENASFILAFEESGARTCIFPKGSRKTRRKIRFKVEGRLVNCYLWLSLGGLVAGPSCFCRFETSRFLQFNSN